MAQEKMWVTAVVILIGVYLIVNMGGSSDVDVNVQQDDGAQCSQNPSYSYGGVDKFTASTVGGTDRIKQNGQAPVTSLAGPTVGTALKYWLDNATVYCPIVEGGNSKCGTNSIQATCIANVSSYTLKVYDDDAAGSPEWTEASHNITMGANAAVHTTVKYLGTSKESGLPFGGCVAIEYPSTLSSVTLSGALSSATPCPYKWTYSVSSVSNTYQTFAVPANFDVEEIASYKVSTMTATSGATNPSGTVVLTLQSANYYIGNDGNFYLGIEKDKNQDTTKVGSSLPDTATLTLV